MGESSDVESLNKAQTSHYIETPKRNISPIVINDSGYLFKEKPSSDNFRDELQKKDRVLEDFFRTHSEKPSDTLEAGFEIVKGHINSLRSTLGLPEVELDDMKISLVRAEEYDRYYKLLSGASEVTSVGVCVKSFDTVIVKKRENIPDYITASVAFHELIHKFLEKDVQIYSSIEKTERDNHEGFLESRRGGLFVAKVKSEKGSLVGRKWQGELLNELPNFLLQRQFLDDVVNREKHRKVFSKEAEKKDERFNDMYGEMNNYIESHTEHGHRIFLHSTVVNFDNEGNILEGGYGKAMMQLANDLRLLCGDINGEPFWKVFLQAKIDPRKQNELRKGIDSKLGKGFYRKLKEAKYEAKDILDLLVDVQNKLYTQKEE